MRNMVVPLVLLFAGCAFAEETHPSFLLLQQNGRMILVGPPQESTFELTEYNSPFLWEGRSSKATFSSSTAGVTIEFKLDIIGPDWLVVTLAESDEGLLLAVCRTDGGGLETQSIGSHLYSNYTELLEDPEYGSFIATLFRRYGQNPLLPDVDCLRTTLFGLRPAPNEKIEKRCVTLIGRLNDDSFEVRNTAMRELSRPGIVQHALVVAQRMNLTPEQRARIDDIAARYRLSFDEPLVAPLVAVVFPDNDVAMISE
jgi:hypothetical protein